MHPRSFVVGVLTVLLMSYVVSAAPPFPPQAKPPIPYRLAHGRELPPERVAALLWAFGYEAGRDLQMGQTVVLPGLGILRVVRVDGYKDLKDGRPITVPAHNMVEFLPEADLIDAVNESYVEPA